MVDAELCSDSPFRTHTRIPSAVGVLPAHSSLVRMSPGMPSTEASCPSGAAHLPMASYARMSRTKPLTLIWDNSEGSSMGPAEGFLCNYLAVQLRPLPKPASLSPRRCCSEHLRTHHPHANLCIKSVSHGMQCVRKKALKWGPGAGSWPVAGRGPISGGRQSTGSLWHVAVTNFHRR